MHCWQGLILSQAIVCLPPAPGRCLVGYRRALLLLRLLLGTALLLDGRCARPCQLRSLPTVNCELANRPGRAWAQRLLGSRRCCLGARPSRRPAAAPSSWPL